MAHPLRLEILDLVRRQGPLTATQVSDEVGESPANCSFHLRTLAKYGFIEEVPDVKGRSRPWRAADLDWSVDEDAPDPDERRAARSFAAAMRMSTMRRAERWDSDRDLFPEEWRDASFAGEVSVPLTAAELKQVGAELFAILHRYRGRPPPEDSVQVAVELQGFPIRRPSTEATP